MVTVVFSFRAANSTTASVAAKDLGSRVDAASRTPTSTKRRGLQGLQKHRRHVLHILCLQYFYPHSPKHPVTWHCTLLGGPFHLAPDPLKMNSQFDGTFIVIVQSFTFGKCSCFILSFSCRNPPCFLPNHWAEKHFLNFSFSFYFPWVQI